MSIKKLKQLSDGTIANYDTLFEPYARAIGHLLHDWNALQIEFMLLYTDIIVGLSRKPDLELIWSVWHAVPVDRFQRAMIREAARVKYGPSSYKEWSAKDIALWEDIKWALERADSMGRKRDDAAHVPMTMLRGGDGIEVLGFFAENVTRNPIAVRLRYADLIEEFSLYRKQISVLSAFIHGLREHLRSGRRLSLPEKPQWPDRRQKDAHGSSRRQGRSTKRKRQRRSSRKKS